MQIDFHTHGRLTKKSQYDTGFHRDMIAAARETGLDALVLSEHYNTTEYYVMYEEMAEAFEYRQEYYLIDGIKVFMGLEVDVAEGGHVILVAPREVILELRRGLDGHEEEGQFIAVKELLDRAEAHGCLTIAAHPYRAEGHLGTTVAPEQLARFDALDLNATDLFTRGQDVVYEEVKALSERLGNVVVTGSDSHYPVQLGSNRTVLPGDPETVAELRAAVRSGAFAIEVSELLDVKVFAARTAKAKLKAELVAAGG